MVSSVFVAVALAQVFLLVQAAQPSEKTYYPRLTCRRAYQQCDFRFSGYYSVPTFYIPGDDNKAFTPRIVSKDYNVNLGVLNTNNIVPEFIMNGAATPITYFGNQNFTPTHFKPFSIPYSSGSGVGHQTFQGNQLHVADGKCVRLYFTHYQVLDSYDGNVIDNKNDVPRSANKCVVFKLRK